jgi:rieske iron-sulfur protein
MPVLSSRRAMPPCAKGCSPTIARRSIVKLGLGGLCWGAVPPLLVLAQPDPASVPPQKDDVFVRVGDSESKPLTLGDIPGGAGYVSAWPMAPDTKVVRSVSRLNAVLLIRSEPQTLIGASRSDAVAGVLAYSALCTHAGCNLTTWIPEDGVLACDCHASEFDARAAGKVLDGPASRPLPALALKLSGDVLVVAKPFASAIRFDE